MEILDGLNVLNSFSLASLEVGKHFYWQIGNLKVHGQVFLASWFVIAVLLIASIAASRNMQIQKAPSGIQNFMEYVLEFLRDLAKNQLGEKDYRPWLPFIGTLFYLSSLALERSQVTYLNVLHFLHVFCIFT